jgi:hypothetical protein
MVLIVCFHLRLPLKGGFSYTLRPVPHPHTPVVVIPTGEGGEKTKHRWQEFCKIILGKILDLPGGGGMFSM